MPCPHFSREDNDCRLLRPVVAVEEEPVGHVVSDEHADLTLCLASDARYRGCTVYRRQVAELFP